MATKKKENSGRCKDCRFYQPVSHKETGGECHRYPPSDSGFTYTPAESWCGEFRAETARK